MFINSFHGGPFLFYPRDEDVPANPAKGIERMFEGVSKGVFDGVSLD